MDNDIKIKNTRRIVISVLAIVVFLILGILSFSLKDNENTVEQSATVTTPANIDKYGAFHVPSTLASESVRVDIFFDPMCPACGIVDRTISKDLTQNVKDGKVDLYLTPVSFLDEYSTDQYSTRAVNALAEVMNKEPDKVLDFLSSLYENQPEEGADYASVSDEQLASQAVKVGVSQETADLFKEHRFFDWVEHQSKVQINRSDLFPNGFATPGFFVNVTYDDKGVASAEEKVQFKQNNILESYKNAVKVD